jgi:hypothetical protein
MSTDVADIESGVGSLPSTRRTTNKPVEEPEIVYAAAAVLDEPVTTPAPDPDTHPSDTGRETSIVRLRNVIIWCL